VGLILSWVVDDPLVIEMITMISTEAEKKFLTLYACLKVTIELEPVVGRTASFCSVILLQYSSTGF
jgi:hypothetical protein